VSGRLVDSEHEPAKLRAVNRPLLLLLLKMTQIGPNDDVDLEDDDARKHQARQIDRPCLHGADDGSVQSSSLEFRRSVH